MINDIQHKHRVLPDFDEKPIERDESVQLVSVWHAHMPSPSGRAMNVAHLALELATDIAEQRASRGRTSALE